MPRHTRRTNTSPPRFDYPAGQPGGGGRSNSQGGSPEPVFSLQHLQTDPQPEHGHVTIDVREDRLTRETFPQMDITFEYTGNEPLELRWDPPRRKPPWLRWAVSSGQLAIHPVEYLDDHLLDEAECPTIARINPFEPTSAFEDMPSAPMDPGETISETYGIVYVQGETA